jgi:MFS family permease
MFVINTFKNFGMEHIKSDDFLTIVGSVASVFGGIRFVWSYLIDRYSYKLSYSIVLIMNIVFGFTLVLVSNIRGLYLFWVSMIIWAEGAHFALLPTIIVKIFGPNAALVYGIAFSFVAIAQLTGSVLV